VILGTSKVFSISDVSGAATGLWFRSSRDIGSPVYKSQQICLSNGYSGL